MSKAVLVSIQPKWCELIASGKKTIEVRKTKPKLETPFKVYIYETKGKTEIPTFIDEEGHAIYQGRGQVIGEFVCDRLVWVVSHPSIFAGHDLLHKKAIEDACLTTDEAEKYSNGKDVYGWHMSNLVIYDKPRELKEFSVPKEYKTSTQKKQRIYKAGLKVPQSWCYVESEVDTE